MRLRSNGGSLRQARWHWTGAITWIGLLGSGTLSAQDLPEPDRSEFRAMSGAELYRAACSGCHGSDGQGDPGLPLILPTLVPDFSDCSFASREPDADWVAVAHDGGPVRGFSEMMPAFGEILGVEELQRSMDHIRTLCGDDDWPRGELNLPRAMFTEKAYPEDELVWTTDTSLGGDESSVGNEIVYEKRVGSRSQLEVVVPFGFRERANLGGSGSSWIGGLGDVVLGAKHTLFHSYDAGTIFSVGGEAKLPTGDADRGFGGDTTVFETFLSYGQILPSDLFLQAQGVAEFPTRASRSNELVARGVIGWSYTQGEWGRTWSPMLEVQGKKELSDDEEWGWDLAPQLQVTLNTRQHVIANVAVLLPLTDTASRDPRLYVYVLWDWFDGGFFEGW